MEFELSLDEAKQLHNLAWSDDVTFEDVRDAMQLLAKKITWDLSATCRNCGCGNSLANSYDHCKYCGHGTLDVERI